MPAWRSTHGCFAAWLGWAPSGEIEDLNDGLAALDAAVVELPRTRLGRAADAPAARSRCRSPSARSCGATAPARYRDVDPTLFTVVSFVLMFGIMFGDVGHGLDARAARARAPRDGAGRRFAGIRHLWPIVLAAGLSAVVFGFLYGEAFGPTGLLPTLWLDPLDEPITLLVAALGVGAVLLVVSYVLGIVNRWRRGGLREALLAQFGVAGLLVFVGGCSSSSEASYESLPAVTVVGGIVAAVGLVLLAIGLVLDAGRGAAAVTQAIVEFVDAVIRLVSNLVSFTRLAAFGLMHAAHRRDRLRGATALWGGVAGAVAAALVFVGRQSSSRSRSRPSSPACRRCVSSTTSSTRASSPAKDMPFSPWRLPVVSQEEEP